MAWKERQELLKQIEKMQDSRALLYVTGDRRNQETRVHSEVLDYFTDLLDKIGVTKRISLVLYTRGGDGMAAWSLLNLLRMFCDHLEIIIPVKAHSAGTMMAIGADTIVMTKQATISPIDPSINHPLAPAIEGAPAGTRAPVSVEAVQGYLDLVQTHVGKAKATVAPLMLDLARQVHPLVLGETYRRRQQTQTLAEKLLAPNVKKAEDRKKIINFLCSDSGSHDYTFNRREAADLGLHVTKCSKELYTVLAPLYADFRDEMKLQQAFEISQFQPNAVTPFENLRATLESTVAPAVQFWTRGNGIRRSLPPPNVGEQSGIEVTSEGWSVAT